MMLFSKAIELNFFLYIICFHLFEYAYESSKESISLNDFGIHLNQTKYPVQ